MLKTNSKILILVLCLMGALLAGCINDAPSEGRSLVVPGDELPEFDVTLNDGHRVSREQLMGEPALIVLFTTLCGDCRELLPEIESLYREMPEAQIVLIARSESAWQLNRYWEENGFTMPYSPQDDAEVYHKFATSGVPRVYLADSRGVIVSMWDDRDMPDASTLASAMREAD